MQDTRAASRYAKALIELSQEQGVLEQVHDDIQFFISVCNENRGFRLLLQSPVVSHYRKHAIISAIFKGKVSDTTFTIFDIITRKNRENILYNVATEFHAQFNLLRKIQVAQITTTFPIDAQLREQFTHIVKEVTGKDAVELHEKIDPSLIGGFILQVGDRQIDESLKHKLQRLQYSFNHS